MNPIREEILGKPPYHGNYARKLGLVDVASRRVSHNSNDLLMRHTGAKKNQKGEIIYDQYGKEIYFPRQYIVRMINDDELKQSKEEHQVYRQKVLKTIAKILLDHEKAKNSGKNPPPSLGNPYARGRNPSLQTAPKFKLTKFGIPKNDLWDETPSDLRPLDWYLTDQMVARTLESIYTEQELGRWDMFSDNVSEAGCFFSPPYSYVAHKYGFRNANESTVWHTPTVHQAQSPIASKLPQPSQEPSFDASDLIPLDSDSCTNAESQNDHETRSV